MAPSIRQLELQHLKKMRSTIKRTLLSAVKIALPIAFWLLVWQSLALIVNRSFLIPTVTETFLALIDVLSAKNFLKVVLLTLARILAGLLIGTAAGILLSFLSYKFKVVNLFLSPLITVIKSTPVATFIVILWIMLSANVLTVVVAFLMVMPIIWQNLMDGYKAIDKDLEEVCDVFELSFLTRVRVLIIPTLMRYLIPAAITATGLAWKAEIAAEIIAYTKNSIGQQINDAKYFFETPMVFAWTFVIIIMSITLEKLTKYLLGRFKV